MMRGFRKTSAAVVIAAGAHAASTASCNVEKLPVVDDAGSPIVIGVLQSLTGSEAAVGQPQKNAVAAAEWQLNAAGGVLGRRVHFQLVDDGTTSADQYGTIADQLIAAQVPAVIGPTASPEATVLVPRLVGAHVITISSTVTLPSLTTGEPERNRFFFRTLPPNDIQGRISANIMFEKGLPVANNGAPIQCKSLAIVQADDAYGTPYADAVQKRFEELGGTVKVRVKFPTNEIGDYSPQVRQVIDAKSDCVALMCYGPPGAAFMREFRKETDTDTTRDWSRVAIMTSNALYTSLFIQNGRSNKSDPNAKTAVENVYGLLVDPAPDTLRYSAFARLYRAQTQLPPDQSIPRNTANTYDAAVLIALAMQQAGTATDTVKIRDALFDVSRGGTVFGPDQLPEALDAIRRGIDIDYDGSSGHVDFQPNGNVDEDFIVWQVRNGSFVTVSHIKAEDAN